MFAHGKAAEYLRAQLDRGSEVNAWHEQHAGDAVHLRGCDWDQAFLSVWRPSETVGQGTSDQTLAFHPVTRPQPLLGLEAITNHAQ